MCQEARERRVPLSALLHILLSRRAPFLESPPANALTSPMQHITVRQVSCGVKGAGCKYSHLGWKRCYSSLSGFALPKRKVLRVVKRTKEELSVYEDRAKRQQLLQVVAYRLGVKEVRRNQAIRRQIACNFVKYSKLIGTALREKMCTGWGVACCLGTIRL